MRRLPYRALALAGLALAAVAAPTGSGAQAAPTYSSPIALSPNQKLLWVVNPNADSVTIINTATNAVLQTVAVGDEPRSVAVTGGFAFVANAAGNSVTVLRIRNATPVNLDVASESELITGAEPWSVVVSPDGQRAFVANSGQDTITVINVRADGGPSIIGNVRLRPNCIQDDFRRHFQPRGLAVSADNSQLYTARFLSFTRAVNGLQGADQGKIGVLCRLEIDTRSTRLADYQAVQQIPLAARATGFAFTPPDGFPATAFPNQLQSVVIRGNRAYLPNIAASPSPPLRFNLDTFAFVNIVDGIGSDNQTDAGALDLHLGARNPEPGKKRLFFANPWAIAFTSPSGAGNAYVVAAGSDLLVKLDVNAAGDLSFTDDADTTRYIDLNDPDDPATAGANAGKSPRGIVINRAGTRAYVANHVSRNVSVVNLQTDRVIKVIPSVPATPPSLVSVGAEMFFSSRGHFDRPATVDDATSTDERLSSEGWQACSSCHFEGLTDGVVWVFGAGPRKAVPLNASFNPADRNQQRVLNYSALFDEIEDFELNVRNVSGPGALNGANDPNHGLLFQDDADGGDINQAPAVINAFARPNANRNEHTVAGIDALTGLREWVRLAVRTPNAPLDTTEVPGGVSADVIAQGRALFAQAGCPACHGGSHWTKSRKDFDAPPDPGDVALETDPNGADQRPNPIGTQYLDRFLEDIGSFNLGVRNQGNPLGKNVGAREFANAAPVDGQLKLPDALGIDYDDDGEGAGFNVPSLLGIYAVPPYLHNGACETVFCVLKHVQHRTAGNPADVLNTVAKQNRVAKFVESIDTATAPFD